MPTLLNSKAVVDQIVQKLTLDCEKLKIAPCLKVILVGNHPPSLIYTRNKKKFIERLGAKCEIIHLDQDISEVDFLSKVKSIGSDELVHGLFVQLPLPKTLNHLNISNLIPAKKDVDGFHPKNLEKLMAGDCGENSLVACTPKGIITLLDHYKIEIEGKNVVIIGRSMIVGKPLFHLFINRNATVTLCHSRTKDLASFTSRADIIVSAVGSPKFFNAKYLGENKPVLIDVGINHDSQGNLCGDMDFENIKNKSSAITPVPGGVGPMTIASLAQNLIQAATQL